MTPWLVTLLQNHPFLMLAFFAVMIVSAWRIFAKAGQPGWAIFVPIYGQIVHAQVGGLPGWMGLLLFVPIVNLFVAFAIAMGTAKRFGKSPLFGLGLVFASPIFAPVLAFSGARYSRLNG